VVSLGLLLLYARKWLIITLLGVSVSLVLTAALGPPQSPVVAVLRKAVPSLLWQKVVDTFNPELHAYASTAERIEAWNIAWDMALARPLTGWGPQTFPFVGVEIYHKRGPTTHAHNLYLTYWSDLGFPLGTALIAFFAWGMFRTVRSLPRLPLETRWWAVGLLCGLVGYLLFGCFDVAFNESRVNAQFWLFLALLWQLPELYPANSTSAKAVL
jgi:O-antigen ligase